MATCPNAPKNKQIDWNIRITINWKTGRQTSPLQSIRDAHTFKALTNTRIYVKRFLSKISKIGRLKTWTRGLEHVASQLTTRPRHQMTPRGIFNWDKLRPQWFYNTHVTCAYNRAYLVYKSRTTCIPRQHDSPFGKTSNSRLKLAWLKFN